MKLMFSIFSSLKPNEVDFKKALEAHAAWKENLSRYLVACDHSLSPEDVARDNACELGKWIYGKGKACKGWPEYKALLAAHAEFHMAAASVVARANAGQEMLSSSALDEGSAYDTASNAVMDAIWNMKAKVETGE